jgi:hypothetical protein
MKCCQTDRGARDRNSRGRRRNQLDGSREQHHHRNQLLPNPKLVGATKNVKGWGGGEGVGVGVGWGGKIGLVAGWVLGWVGMKGGRSQPHDYSNNKKIRSLGHVTMMGNTKYVNSIKYR